MFGRPCVLFNAGTGALKLRVWSWEAVLEAPAGSMNPRAAAVVTALLLALAGIAHGPPDLRLLPGHPGAVAGLTARFRHLRAAGRAPSATHVDHSFALMPTRLLFLCAGVGTCLSYPNTQWGGLSFYWVESKTLKSAAGECCACAPDLLHAAAKCRMPHPPARATSRNLLHCPADCCTLCQNTPKCDYWNWCGTDPG